jgi:hypothetical protein
MAGVLGIDYFPSSPTRADVNRRIAAAAEHLKERQVKLHAVKRRDHHKKIAVSIVFCHPDCLAQLWPSHFLTVHPLFQKQPSHTAAIFHLTGDLTNQSSLLVQRESWFPVPKVIMPEIADHASHTAPIVVKDCSNKKIPAMAVTKEKGTDEDPWNGEGA